MRLQDYRPDAVADQYRNPTSEERFVATSAAIVSVGAYLLPAAERRKLVGDCRIVQAKPTVG